MKMAILLAAMCVAACAPNPPDPTSEEAQVQEAKEAVKRRLRDPESAQFSVIRQTKVGVVCGYVNSKNGFGGYAGKERFVYVGGFGSEKFPTDLWGVTLETESKCTPSADGCKALDFQRDFYRKLCR